VPGVGEQSPAPGILAFPIASSLPRLIRFIILQRTADMPAATDTPYWHLSFNCPNCKGKGMIPWNRLTSEHRLYCRGCKHWYGVTGQGKLYPTTAPEKKVKVAVRTSFSAWVEYHRTETFGRYSITDKRFWKELGVAIYSWLSSGSKSARTTLGVTGAVAMLMIGWFAMGPASVEAVAPPAPETIAERAPIFAAAWATRQFSTMMQFTIPDQLEPLKRWSALLRLPSDFQDLEFNDVAAEVVSVTPQKDPHQALVKMRIMPRGAEGAAGDGKNLIEQVEYWREIDGKWFFSAKESEAALPPSASVGYVRH
jgi:hypothetical protein